jgi:putative SOS response-associated peptidase YedK
VHNCHYFSSPDGRPLAFAGLWETWRDPESDARVDSATIIVGAANEWMSRFHDRMPVILDWCDAGAWMAGDDPGSLLRAARGCLAGMDRFASREPLPRWR